MSRRFKIKKAFWCGRDIYTKSSVILNPGFTTLVGCNGSGKSTLLLILQRKFDSDGTPYISFDNLTEGGSVARDNIAYSGGSMQALAERLMSSEGENIYLNLYDFTEEIGNKVKECKANGDKELWILLDAIDSGLSIDLIDDIKKLFFYILHDAEDMDIYIVCSANEYEMVVDSNTLDIINLKYISIKSYDEFRKVILKSSKKKLEMYEAYERRIKDQEAFFKNVPGVGNMYVHDRIFEFDHELMVFTCLDDMNNIYLCVCDDNIEKFSWIIVPIEQSKLNDVLSKSITILTPFKEADDIIVADREIGDPIENTTYRWCNYYDIDESELPYKDQYIL